jgi:hypothetical protein
MPPPAELIRLPLVLQPSAGDVVVERDVIYGPSKLLAAVPSSRPASIDRTFAA